jgi:hypothetical protein
VSLFRRPDAFLMRPEERAVDSEPSPGDVERRFLEGGGGVVRGRRSEASLARNGGRGAGFGQAWSSLGMAGAGGSGQNRMVWAKR